MVSIERSENALLGVFFLKTWAIKPFIWYISAKNLCHAILMALLGFISAPFSKCVCTI